MSANRAAGKAAPRPPAQDVNFEEWNEEQLEAALQRLKEAHLKLRSLRSTIPRMIQPLTLEPAPPPEILQAKAQASLLGAMQEVKGFKETVSNDEFRKVIDHATVSRRRNGKNIKPWKARDDPDWANV
ncbi:hypothetical protein SEUCBS139899_006690 [Sporothrix eucalyptigena]|uniref:Uncharacterized protein n=1 Tax=Sporothrix eucalyptigena TaxID=1812306 RepID=A0ABP0BB71_9PEZI